MGIYWSTIVFAFVFAFMMAVAGCSYLMQAQDKSAEQIAKAVTQYCKNTDEATRMKFRADINAKAAPNSIAVMCR